MSDFTIICSLKENKSCILRNNNVIVKITLKEYILEMFKVFDL